MFLEQTMWHGSGVYLEQTTKISVDECFTPWRTPSVSPYLREIQCSWSQDEVTQFVETRCCAESLHSGWKTVIYSRRRNLHIYLNYFTFLIVHFRFLVKAGEFTYAVTICSDVSKDHPSAAATKSYNSDGKNTTVIGRLNDTHIVGGSKYLGSYFTNSY